MTVSRNLSKKGDTSKKEEVTDLLNRKILVKLSFGQTHCICLQMFHSVRVIIRWMMWCHCDINLRECICAKTISANVLKQFFLGERCKLGLVVVHHSNVGNTESENLNCIIYPLFYSPGGSESSSGNVTSSAGVVVGSFFGGVVITVLIVVLVVLIKRRKKKKNRVDTLPMTTRQQAEGDTNPENREENMSRRPTKDKNGFERRPWVCVCRSVFVLRH